MWFIGVEVEQKTSAPPPRKNPGSALLGKYLIPPFTTTNNKYLIIPFPYGAFQG